MKLTVKNLNEKYFINSENEIEVENIMKLLNENICSFKEIVNKFKNIKDEEDDPCLYNLLENKEFFEELIESNKLNTEDTRYLLNRIDGRNELCSLNRNTSLLKYIIENDLLSFKELVDRFKSIRDSADASCLCRLVWNKEFFKESIETNKLNEEDLRYLLNTIDRRFELDNLSENTLLIKEILNEFVLDKDLIDRFNTLIEGSYLCKYHNIHTVFDMIEYKNKSNEEILKLNELNRKIYNFELNLDQQLELAEILKDSEIARNTLIQIIDSNLEDQYDFESLKNLLTKDSDKNLKIKFNF